jgi:hypothetical protein
MKFRSINPTPMKRQNIFRIIIISGLILIMASCGEDYLYLENMNAVTTGNFYRTESDAEDALIAAYAAICWRGFHGNNFQFLYLTLDDRLIHENAQYELFVFTANDGRLGSFYYDLFKGVYRCNILLQNLEDIPMNKDVKDLYYGQLYFLRGFYYFYLAMIFNAPPLVTYATEDPNITYGNAPQEEIYNFVENQLRLAIPLLPWEWTNAEDIGRATKGAALAMLGKTYLYQQVWDSASYFFKELIDNGPNDLMQPPETNADSLDYLYAYLCNFSPIDLSTSNKTYKAENNIESVFSAQFNDGFSTWGHYWNPGWQNDGSLFSAYFGINGWRNVVPTKVMAEQYESVSSHPAGYPRDPRFYASIFTPGDIIDCWYPEKKDYYMVPFKDGFHNLGAISQGYGLKKYCFPMHLANAAAPFQDPNNWRIIRFSDVLLMYAEAQYHLDPGSGDGLAALNRVRSRVGMPPIGALGKEAIIHERDVELAFECIRFFDLVRWSRPDEHGETWAEPEELVTNYIKDKCEFLPIPLSEINVMQGKLKQNKGW